jgi:hypothetical protein
VDRDSATLVGEPGRVPIHAGAKSWGLIGSAAAAVVLLIGLAGLWAGVVLFKVKTRDGVLIVEVNEPGAEVYIDGDRINVTWDKAGKRAEIGLKSGTRQIEVKKDGFTAHGEEVTLEDRGRKVLVARLQRTTMGGFRPLFNGKDLTGWKQLPKGKAKWEAKDGVLTGKGDIGHLFYFTSNYENFRLRVEARINGGGSGGVYFRQPFGPSKGKGYPSTGFSVRISSTSGTTPQTGTLYFDNREVVKVTDSAVRPNEWFALDIVADGPHVVVRVNGTTTADYVHAEPRAPAGQIALGVNDADSAIAFRMVEIEELPPGDRLLRWVSPRGRYDQVKGNLWMENIDGRCKFMLQVRDNERFLFAPSFDPNDRRPTWVQLRRDSCHVLIGNERWAKWYDGKWQVRERPAPVEKSSAAKLGAWVPLFNGKDTSGWDMVSRDRSAWTFEDGALVIQSKNSIPSVLFSQRADYDHFHLRMEAMLSEGAQGWIVLRAGPSEGGRGDDQGYGIRIGEEGLLPGAGTGSLALIARASLPYLLCAAPRFELKHGVWFPLEIIVTGNRVRVLIAGKSAVDYTNINDAFTIGRLGLRCQRGGSEVRFRNVEIKELPPPAEPPPLPDVAHDAKGFVPLFNGKDLTGWKVFPEGADNWEVKDGILTCRRGLKNFLFTERDDYQDFHLRVEARIDKAGNSGVFFWMDHENPYSSGIEAEVVSGRDTGTLLQYALGKTIWRERTPDRLMAVNEWFTLEVIAQGNRVRTLVNGKPAASKTFWVKNRARSNIALQHHTPKTVIEFRKVEIRELPPTR